MKRVYTSKIYITKEKLKNLLKIIKEIIEEKFTCK